MKVLIIETDASSKTDILFAIASHAEKNGITTSANRLLKAFDDREKEFSTAFENEIAIPHARIKEVKQSAIIIARNSRGVAWKSLDGKPTRYAIGLVIEGSDAAGNEHMNALSAVSSLLIEPTNVEVFKTGKVEAIERLIQQKMAEMSAPTAVSANDGNYDFVAVTACPTGVAHTNMAAEALERFARENNLHVKVERQAAQGTVNALTEDDMAKTDHVILAIGRNIDGMERFDGKKLVKVGVAAPLKDAPKLWKDVQDAGIYRSSVRSANGGVKKDSSATEKKGVSDRTSIMGALMTGLSYMIPIVIVGGIFLAFGLGIGRLAVGGDVTDGSHNGSIWYVLFQIGVVGINLAVIVLAGFIAQAIGGRLALAPALIVAAFCSGIALPGGDNPFFNYETKTFGVSHSNLSFFGSIAAGLLIGYAAKYWTLYVSPRIPKNIRTIEPIIIVPILFVFVGWLVFSFFLYLPLYYLSIGLDKGVRGLIDNRLLWIAGAIGGGMLCFDLGGPVNKIAFGTGVALIGNKSYEFMGAIAAAGSVAPFGMALGWFLGAKVLRIEKLRNDEMLKDSFVPALFMGFVGISEGAIPFAIKNPKTAIVSNVIGGMIAGALSGAFLVTDTAAHTGPIVYLLGAVGRNGNTDYLYGLLYLVALAAGSVATAIIFAALEFFFDRRLKSGKGSIQLFDKLIAKLRRNAKSDSAVKTAKTTPSVPYVWSGYMRQKMMPRNRG